METKNYSFLNIKKVIDYEGKEVNGVTACAMVVSPTAPARRLQDVSTFAVPCPLRIRDRAFGVPVVALPLTLLLMVLYGRKRPFGARLPTALKSFS